MNARTSYPLIVENAALYTSELLTLVDEVQALMLANLGPCRQSDGPLCVE